MRICPVLKRCGERARQGFEATRFRPIPLRGEERTFGAGVGAAGGGIEKRSAKKEQEAQQQAAKRAYQNNLDGYNRAKATCLEGRGYSVSY